MTSFRKSNAWQRILSLLISITLWVFVVIFVNPQTTTTVKRVPVILTNSASLTEQNLILLETSPTTIDIEVQGTRRLLSMLTPSSIRATVDLALISGTGLSYPPVDVSLPYSEVVLLEKTPPTININVDRMDEREIPVFVELHGDPATGFVSHETSVAPDTVLVKAPQSVLSTIDKAVVILDVSGAQATSTSTQKLHFYSANNIQIQDKNLSSIPAVATAKSVILRKKRVPIVPLLQNSAPAGSETTATVVENQAIDILGDADIINGITFINTEPIDISRMTTTNQRTLSLDIPNGIMLDPNITHVTVNLEVKMVQ